MAFGKKETLVGLDIGSKTVKAAEILESKRGRELKRFGMTEIPHGAIEDGTINDPESVADSIRQLLESSLLQSGNRNDVTLMQPNGVLGQKVCLVSHGHSRTL